MRWLRTVVSAAGVGIVVGAAVAFAASISFSSASLGAGSASTGRCTNTGLSVLQNLSGSNVASVTVGSIPAGCAGATLLVSVTAGATKGSGSATVPAGGGSVTVTLSTTPAVTASELTDLVLIGP
jgi:hypothetical protein